MPDWSLEILAEFDADVAGLRKHRYRKNARDAAAFDRLISELLENLRINPMVDNLVEPRVRFRTQSYPTGHSLPGGLLRFARFRMPGLTGAAKYGRVYFDVLADLRRVRMLGTYTHAEQDVTLDDRDLIRRLRQAPLFESAEPET